MSNIRDPYDVWKQNEAKKLRFAEFYGKKPKEEPKYRHISTKFTKIADLAEKPVKSDDSDSKYVSREAIQRYKDWHELTDSIRIAGQSIDEYVDKVKGMKQTKAPASTPDPNQAFKHEKIRKDMVSLLKTDINKPNHEEEYDLPEDDLDLFDDIEDGDNTML